MPFDLVVRNGTVVDGSGRPRFGADIGVTGGRIVELGRIREKGAEEVDAEGHFVTPGFIEIHSHMDAQIFWDPMGTCASWHGVTTTVMGNCGFTIAPCREAEKDFVLRSLERAEDISRDAMLAGIEWQWETYAEYLDVVDRLPKGINFAGYIGHSALRTYVMGERAFEEPATEEDIDAMRREVAAAIAAGAVGFTTSRSPNHETADERPVPSRQATWGEVRALVGVLGEMGTGLFELANEQHPTPELRRDYRCRLRDLAVETGRPVTFIVNQSPVMPGLWQDYLALCDEGAAMGGRLFGQVHSREFLSVMGFPTNLPFDRFPAWRDVRSRPLAEQRALLARPEVRSRLVDEAQHGTYRQAIGTETRPPRYDAMRILDSAAGPWRTVAEVAEERGTNPVDAMIDLALAADFNLFFGQPFANEDRATVLELIRHPRTVVGVSDSGAHVSQIVDSSIPTFLLAHWVRDRQALTWEDGVRKLTFDPALAWGFRDRGLIQEGAVADLVVLDPERVGPGVPYAATDLPAGAKRLKQEATGILATVVNGAVTLREGKATGALPGRVVRNPVAAAARHD